MFAKAVEDCRKGAVTRRRLRGVEGRGFDMLSVVPNSCSRARFSNSHSELYTNNFDSFNYNHVGSVHLVGTLGSSTVLCVNCGWPYQKQDEARHCIFVSPKSNPTQTQRLQQISTVKYYFIAFMAWGGCCQRMCNNRLPYTQRSIGDALANAGESPAAWSVVRINTPTTTSLRLSTQPSTAFVAGEDDFGKRPATTTWHLRCRMISKMSNNSGMVREPGNPTNSS
jgi:hypothetical protein